MQENAGKSRSGKKYPQRRELSRGMTRDIASVANYVARPALSKTPTYFLQILNQWNTVAGPDLARFSSPQKLHSGVLTLIASGGTVAIELQHMSDTIIERVNRVGGLVGDNKVTSLRVIQGVLPNNNAQVTPKKVRKRNVLEEDELEEMLNKIDDPELRESTKSLAHSLFRIERD